MPHKEELTDFTPEEYPPFPESKEFPTVDLETISLQKVLDHDPAEEDRIFEACKTRGFFFLDLAGPEAGETILHGSGEIARIASRTMAMDMDEKMKYLPKAKSLFGWALPFTTPPLHQLI